MNNSIDLRARELLAKSYGTFFPDKVDRVINGPWTLQEDAAIRAISSALTGWEPIDTAPKDGTIFLGVQIESFIGQELIRAPMYWANDDWHLAWTYWIDGCSECEPTHWMPLPEPPK